MENEGKTNFYITNDMLDDLETSLKNDNKQLRQQFNNLFQLYELQQQTIKGIMFVVSVLVVSLAMDWLIPCYLWVKQLMISHIR